MKKYLIMVCCICLSLIACDRSEQTKKKVTKEQPSQYTGAKEKTAEENDSTNIELIIKRAENHYANKEYNKAINHFLMVYEIDKKNLTALISLGNLYYDTQQNKKAIEFYEKVLELDPANLNVRSDMGTCYARIGMVEKGIELNRKNIEMNFHHAQSHYNLAVLLERIGNKKEADEERILYNEIILGLQKQ